MFTVVAIWKICVCVAMPCDDMLIFVFSFIHDFLPFHIRSASWCPPTRPPPPRTWHRRAPCTRGLHPSTSQLNLSQFWSLKPQLASTSQIKLSRLFNLNTQRRERDASACMRRHQASALPPVHNLAHQTSTRQTEKWRCAARKRYLRRAEKWTSVSPCLVLSRHVNARRPRPRPPCSAES
jgi:hypothetical protein